VAESCVKTESTDRSCREPAAPNAEMWGGRGRILRHAALGHRSDLFRLLLPFFGASAEDRLRLQAYLDSTAL
jgi:hypothetical protein